MKGESVFAADIGEEQPKDNVVCESGSPWIPLSKQLSSSLKRSSIVVLFATITSIIYDSEAKRGVRHLLFLIRCSSVLIYHKWELWQCLNGMFSYFFEEKKKTLWAYAKYENAYTSSACWTKCIFLNIQW